MAEDASKKSYSYLDQLSTEELEIILRSSALSEEADDLDLVDHILEVIVLREKEKNDVQEVERARKDFEKFYRDLDKPLYPTAEDQAETADPKEPRLTRSQTGTRRMKHILVAAAVIAALISLTCIPVFGDFSIVQMVAYWTAEQFGFYMPKQGGTGASNDPSGSAQVPKEYEELQAAMQQLGADLVIPNFPDDFEVGEPILSFFSEKDEMQFIITYQKQEDFYVFTIEQVGIETANHNRYEKIDSFVECCVYNGIEHYIISNTENNTATWNVGGFEYHIVTNMPTSNLKVILESMYEV